MLARYNLGQFEVMSSDLISPTTGNTSFFGPPSPSWLFDKPEVKKIFDAGWQTPTIQQLRYLANLRGLGVLGLKMDPVTPGKYGGLDGRLGYWSSSRWNYSWGQENTVLMATTEFPNTLEIGCFVAGMKPHRIRLVRNFTRGS